MLLKSISLVHFKNYLQHEFLFNNRVVAICGPNGAGKTNLLDAIYYLCFTKSYFIRSDAAVVKDGMAGFRLEGNFIKEGNAVSVVCLLRENGKKEVVWNNELYDKFSAHIGRLPCVFIAPDDVRLITDGSEERRKFLDTILSQTEADYLQLLILYNKVLSQRNSYLKSVSYSNADTSLLDVYDHKLAEYGVPIFLKRKSFLEGFYPLVKKYYHQIAESGDNIEILYKTAVKETGYLNELKKARSTDLLQQRTGFGIHKDDIEFLLGEKQFKYLASQGQRKTLLFALKLAEFQCIKTQKGFTPVMLLDDVFEKLDEQRMKNLLKIVCEESEGQVFITDTHANRVADHLLPLGISPELIYIEK